MLAMSMTEGTRHACHISFLWDQVCLPSFFIGTRYASMSSPFCHQHGKQTWSPLLLTWQAYLVRNKTDMTKMAIIPSPPLYRPNSKRTRKCFLTSRPWSWHQTTSIVFGFNWSWKLKWVQKRLSTTFDSLSSHFWTSKYSNPFQQK